MINNYKLKSTTTISDLLQDGFKYSANMKYLVKIVVLKGNIELWIKIQLTNNKSFDIEVLDSNWDQPYTPFYRYLEGNIKPFKFLGQVINRYNAEMDNLECFEREGNND